jgi:hypothetical protein
MNLSRALPLLVLALVAGCANFGAVAPGTPAEEARMKLGQPADIWKNPDGSETWEYRYGPAGFRTYMVAIGPDRAVRAVDQVLQDAFFSKITPGMQRDQVHRLLGKPKEIQRYDRLHEEVWSWRYRQENVWYYYFNVHFDEATGAVMRVSKIEDPYYTDKGGRDRR